MTFIKLQSVSCPTYPIKQDFLYGEWLRSDFDCGNMFQVVDNEDLSISLYQALRHNKRLYGNVLLEDIIFDIPFYDVLRAMKSSKDNLVVELKEDAVNVILTLCRMIATIKNETIYSKDKAALLCLNLFDSEDQVIIKSARNTYLYGSPFNVKENQLKKTVNNLNARTDTLLREALKKHFKGQSV